MVVKFIPMGTCLLKNSNFDWTNCVSWYLTGVLLKFYLKILVVCTWLVVETALMHIQTTSGRWFTQTGLIIALARLHRLSSVLIRIPMRIR